ncbi:hypothetical protein LMG33818_002196 [Halomonadaceae bacterium LMG 33818]|uniref:type III secretion system cytoplasmic ring protein SctQ n=1 Tax=Cernens ardua TaxID=3402176 RepID=UPI003EDC6034
MTITPLAFENVSTLEQQARTLLGKGRKANVAQGEMSILLEPVANEIQATHDVPFLWQIRQGVIQLSNASPLLGMVSECPVTLGDSLPDDSDWFWGVYNAFLDAQVKSLFGDIRPASVADIFASPIKLTLTITREGRSVDGLLEMDCNTLVSLLSEGNWETISTSLPDDFALRLPVIIGKVALSEKNLQSLKTGDLICPQTLYFDTSGVGHLVAERQFLHVRFSDTGTSLVIIDQREHDMNTQQPAGSVNIPETGHTDRMTGQETTYDESSFADGLSNEINSVEHDAGQAPQPFDDLILPLTVRCGSLELTLEELKNLQVGNVLTLEGVTPGEATLYYGERPLASGELVSVDGRLGLQIRQLDSGD